MIGMWLRLVTCSNRFLRVRFMEGKLSCFCTFLFFLFSSPPPNFNRQIYGFSVVPNCTCSLLEWEFSKFNKGRIRWENSKMRTKQKMSIFLPIESKNWWIVHNGFVEMGSNTTNKIARGMKSWQELHLIYIENQFCTITLLRVAAISQEKKKRKEEHLRRKPRNILTSIVSEV